MRLQRRTLGRTFVTLAALLMIIAACTETLDQATGVVVSIESPALGRVESFELLTRDGETLRFDTSELTFRPEFPVAHLGEHQLLSEPIEVTYRREGERLVVTRMTDAG